jgi:hypothetical protein
MKTVVRRIARLEDQFKTAIEPDFLPNPRHRLRLVVSEMDHRLNFGNFYVPADSHCKRITDGSREAGWHPRRPGGRGIGEVCAEFSH